jgi:CheY-like chemotaxis protein/HPt (histidine-containing phosphotransfer) domain-containing protein
MLASWGMVPTAAASALEGILRLRTAATAGKPFRLLLLDERMPGMDGFAMAEKIRRDDTLPEMNIMMLSSGDVSAAAERCRQVGIATYLIKPLRQSELFDTLMETFNRDPVPEEAPPGPDDSPHQSRNARILLAEDNRVNQILARTLLQKRGWTVLTVTSGEEAVSAWRQGEIDLILMDVQMPEMDGLQATRLICEEEKNRGRHIPIIGLTAHAMKGDREVCLEAGMDDYVPKPLRAEVLYAAVERWLPKEEDFPAVDLDRSLLAIGGDTALLADLAAEFVRDCPNAGNELRSALAAKDLRKLERTAHSLKSVVGIFRAQKALELLQKLEGAAKNGMLKGAEELLPQVLAELERVGKNLAAFLAEADRLCANRQR